MSGTDTPAAPDKRIEAMATSFSRNAAESSRQGSDSEALQRMFDDAAIVSGTNGKMNSGAVFFLVQNRTDKTEQNINLFFLSKKVLILKQIKQNRTEPNISEHKY